MWRRGWLAAAVLVLTVGSFAAGPSRPNQVTVFEGVTPQNVSGILSASERAVWDRFSGIAVAQVRDSELQGLRSLQPFVMGPAESPEAFQEALSAFLPEYSRAESLDPEDVGRYAGMEPKLLVNPEGAARTRTPAPEKAVPESTCLYEDWEVLPIWEEEGGMWWHYQGGQPYNNVGDYFWYDTNCDSFGGDYDCEAIMGGDYGIGLPCDADYDYDTNSWLEYAPWLGCAYGAPGAELRFYAKVDTVDHHDYFFYGFSPDGVNYYGYTYWGNYGEVWYEYHRNMRTWYQIGDLTRYGHLALAFAFKTDVPGNAGFGVRLDDISITTSPIGVTLVQKAGNPFRLFVSGAGFLPGAAVYVDGVPVPMTVYKGGDLLVAKGGAALKAMLPKGVWVTVSVVNPDGASSTGYDFQR